MLPRKKWAAQFGTSRKKRGQLLSHEDRIPRREYISLVLRRYYEGRNLKRTNSGTFLDIKPRQIEKLEETFFGERSMMYVFDTSSFSQLVRLLSSDQFLDLWAKFDKLGY